MRFTTLIIVVLVLAAGWSGWWWFGSTAKQDAIETWLAERREDGWVAETADLAVTGFPNRFDTRFKGLDLSDPESGWAWNAPEFQLLALSYKPNELIAVWPGEQRIASPEGTVTIAGDPLRGSIAVRPDAALTLDRAIIEAGKVVVTGEDGAGATLERVVLASEPGGELAQEGRGHRIGFSASNLILSERLRRDIDSSGILPAAMEAARLDATLAFDRSLSLASVEEDLPGIDRIDLDDFNVNWGELDIRAKGALVADGEGRANGTLNIRARNWKDMLKLAASSGAISDDTADAATFALGLIAGLSGDSNSITVPLTFENGIVRLGPIVVGDAPRLK